MGEDILNYIRITEENIDKEHICCAMSGKQSAVKKEWLKPYESPVNMLSCAYNCASNTAANKD